MNVMKKDEPVPFVDEQTTCGFVYDFRLSKVVLIVMNFVNYQQSQGSVELEWTSKKNDAKIPSRTLELLIPTMC